LPDTLPVPEDDGATQHLQGRALPSITLQSTSGKTVNLTELSGLSIIFCYPRTGAPDETIPASWDAIPGARGCTPQACSFRDHADDLAGLGVKHIFGLSTQDSPYQQEAAQRLHLPYQLLSDEHLELADALKMPTFEWEGTKVLKRVTLAVLDGKIIRVWYPVFPTNQSASEVVKWLKKADDKS
jgi:peroxiredoxin